MRTGACHTDLLMEVEEGDLPFLLPYRVDECTVVEELGSIRQQAAFCGPHAPYPVGFQSRRECVLSVERTHQQMFVLSWPFVSSRPCCAAVWMGKCSHFHMHAFMRTHVHVHTFVFTHTYIFLYIGINTRSTYIHTSMQSQGDS